MCSFRYRCAWFDSCPTPGPKLLRAASSELSWHHRTLAEVEYRAKFAEDKVQHLVFKGIGQDL
jgi:hypothetical protein